MGNQEEARVRFQWYLLCFCLISLFVIRHKLPVLVWETFFSIKGIWLNRGPHWLNCPIPLSPLSQTCQITKSFSHQREETQSSPALRIRDRSCLSYFSIATAKQYVQGNLERNVRKSMTIKMYTIAAGRQAGRWAGGQAWCWGSTENSHLIQRQVAEKEDDWEWHGHLKPHSPSPVTHLQKDTPCNPPQIVPPSGKPSIPPYETMGPLSFKPPQRPSWTCLLAAGFGFYHSLLTKEVALLMNYKLILFSKLELRPQTSLFLNS